MAKDIMEKAAEEVPAPSKAQVPLHLWQIALRHKSLALVGLVVALVLGGLYYARQPKTYQSTAQLLVVKKRSDEVTGMDTHQMAYEDYVATHQVLIRSPEIINRALLYLQKRNQTNVFSSTRGKENLTEVIQSSLVVSRNRTSGTSNNVLDLSFRDKDPAACSVILGAVIDSYKDFLEETYRVMSDDTLKLIQDARDNMQKDLATKKAEYRAFRQQAPLMVKHKDGSYLSEDGLISIAERRSTLLLRQAELEGQLTALESAQREGKSREALLAMVADFTSKPETEDSKGSHGTTLKDDLLPLMEEERTLRQTLGPNHPEVVAIHQRIEAARDLYTRPSAVFTDRSETGGPGTVPAGVDPVTTRISYLKDKIQQIKLAENLLGEIFKSEQEEARKLIIFEDQDKDFRDDITRKEEFIDGIIKRLKDVSLIKQVGGYDAKAITPPTPAKKVGPNGTLIFSLATLLGMLGGFGLAYLAELTDRSFRTPEEIHQRLGLPVMGQIPYLKVRGSALPRPAPAGIELHPSLCAYYRPQSLESEAYRGVRTALYFSTRGLSHPAIQVTSPNLGDGKTTLAGNLAVSIAHSGKRVILVDADLRRPRCHKLFGLSAEMGLSSVLIGEACVEKAVQDTGVPGLFLLSSGPQPPNPAELLNSGDFKDVLKTLKQDFDFVLVDTPPLLAVTDPCVVAPNVDGVLLNLRVAKNARPPAERAREILATLEARVLGVVINDPDRTLGGQGYGYGYGYNDSYYREEEIAEEGTSPKLLANSQNNGHSGGSSLHS